MRFQVTVNGKSITRNGLRPDDLLIDFLHEEGMTGTKYGCGIGACGACKVAVQSSPESELVPVLACYARLKSVQGLYVTTVEGLAGRDGTLHPLQEAFLGTYAFQCGYSTPGMLMAGAVLIDRLKRRPISRGALDREITSAISNHVCRCTGYVRYFEAIKQVVQTWPGAKLVDETIDEAGNVVAPPCVWFRVTKRSRNDLKEKTLEGRFESPTTWLRFARPGAWEACEGEVRVQIANLRTGEAARDMNLGKFLFFPLRELSFRLERAKAGGVSSPGEAVPLEVGGSLHVGRVRVKVSARVEVAEGAGGKLTARTLEPIRVPLASLGLPLADFLREFGLTLGPEVEFGLDGVAVDVLDQAPA